MLSLSNSTRISIFDIPHILDLICEDLSKDQLLTCLEVSRAWRANFTPQALRYVRFSNLKSHQTWTIIRRAGLIRYLTIDIADAGWFLNNPEAATCINLRELHCVDFNYQPKPKPCVDQSNNALRLIESCPKLETLVVDNLSSQYYTDHFTEAVLKSIFNHSSLTKIKIHLDSAPREFRTVLIKSLPTGLKDFELSIKGHFPRFNRRSRWCPAPEMTYPKDGYPWQRNEQQDFAESSSFSGSGSLSLERLVLRELRPGPTPEWRTQSLDEDTDSAVIIDHVVLNPEANRRYYPYHKLHVQIEMVRSFVERLPGLRYLVLTECDVSWFNLLQLLLDNCSDLVTIDLLDSRYSSFHSTNAYSTYGNIQFVGSFPVLKEFTMSGYMSEQLYEAVALMLVQSVATLEVVRIDRENHEQAFDGANPFHIGTTASWTQCTRLKELGIFQNGESLITDSFWELPAELSIYEPNKDCLTVFGKLEKLQLAVCHRDPLRNQHPNQSHCIQRYVSWYVEEAAQLDDSDLDEQDDEDWKPLNAINQNAEKTQERQRQLVERNHQRAFILQVRELFGRLKELEKLRELEIEWFVCYNISEMSLRDALELFRETEVKGNRHSNEYERTSRGWWGEVTEEDLVWLCLPWASRPNVDSSKLPLDIINAAARQYENKTQLPVSCHDIPNRSSSSKRPPWSTGDIYNTRVGRTWKDWRELTGADHEIGHRHVVNSLEFEVYVEGILGGIEETRWGRKKATKGEGGRYRQKVIGKANQRK